jgi:hypothetical protein
VSRLNLIAVITVWVSAFLLDTAWWALTRTLTEIVSLAGHLADMDVDAKMSRKGKGDSV